MSSKKFKNSNSNEEEYDYDYEVKTEEKKEEKKTEKKIQVISNNRGWICKIKVMERTSRKGNKIVFLRLSQGRKVGDRVIGGKIDIPIFRIRHFVDDIRLAIEELLPYINDEDLVSINRTLLDIQNVIQKELKARSS